MKVLVVVDMQNDFISGPLGSAEAQAIVPAVAQRIKDYLAQDNTMIIFTRDTHYPDTYEDTIEGKKLPVPHCYSNTYGWEIIPELVEALEDKTDFNKVLYLNKTHFGSLDLVDVLESLKVKNPIDYIELCGVCTDICVVSNALLIKASNCDFPVLVNADLCAGTSKENHDAALLTMKNCHVDIID